MLKVKLFKFFIPVIIILSVFMIFSLSSTLFAANVTSDFNQLNSTKLVSEMGAAWNLGNQLEAVNNGTPSETAWGNPTISKALITKVKESGFNTIRIPVSYFNKIGSAPDYTIDSNWLNRIQEVVDYAYSQDIYVIINVHGDAYNTITDSWLLVNSSDQTTIKAKYQKLWEQIANKFGDYDEHLIFESMNEVFDGTWSTPNSTYYANLNDYNQIFVDTVRQTTGNNSARWLLVPGWNTNIGYTADDYGFQIPKDTNRSSTIPSSEKRIAISVHYYDPWDFCGEESGTITQWGPSATDSSKTSTWGQEDFMESQFQKMYNTFVAKGYPFIVGEYGSIDKTSADSTNNTYREIYAKTLCSTAKKYGGVPVYWDNGYNGTYGFGLFNRSNYTVTQQGIIDAIMSGVGTTTTTSTSTSTSTQATTPTTTSTVTSTSTPVTTGNYLISYDIKNDWGSGATVNLTIKNSTSSDINGWTLEFSFPGDQSIANLWNASLSQSGRAVSISDAGWNGTISKNGGTVSFGFNLSYTGSNDEPTNFTLNGEECEIQ